MNVANLIGFVCMLAVFAFVGVAIYFDNPKDGS